MMRYPQPDIREGDSHRKSQFYAEEKQARTEREISLRSSYQQRGGEQRLHMRFARNAVSDYENRVILENICPAFLDMYTSRNGSDLDVYYQMTGYIGLKAYVKNRNFSGRDVLKMVTDVLELIKSCEEYLIFPEYISLRADHIFVSQEDGTLHLMYLPGYRTTKPMKKLIAGLIDDLHIGSAAEKAENSLLLEYREEIINGEYGIQGCINLAEDLIRQKVHNERPEEWPLKLEEGIQQAGEQVCETRSAYFDGKVSSLISVKKKLTEFVDNFFV